MVRSISSTIITRSGVIDARDSTRSQTFSFTKCTHLTISSGGPRPPAGRDPHHGRTKVIPEGVKLISVDDHVVEHPAVWSDRLPAGLREQGPRVVTPGRGEPFEGQQVWLFSDRVYSPLAWAATAGRRVEDINADPSRYEDMIPGCYDPAARIKDMDADGIQAQLCFP